LRIAGKIFGNAGKILGIAGRRAAFGIANGWQGLARADEQGAELRAQSRRPRRASPDSGLIKRYASTEVAGIDPAVGAFQVVHGFEPACPSCRYALAGRTCRNGVRPL
jgi:hypothetical protein